MPNKRGPQVELKHQWHHVVFKCCQLSVHRWKSTKDLLIFHWWKSQQISENTEIFQW